MTRPVVRATVSSESPIRVVVTSAVDSVSPYALITMSKDSSLFIARISDSGMVVPPVMETRSDDRSYDGRSGCLIRSWKIVGGPSRMLTFSLAMMSSARPASKTGIGMTVTPCIREASQPALYPKQWKNGGMIRKLSERAKVYSSAIQPYARSDWPCVRTTPLG